MRSIQRGITTTFIIIIILAAAVSITAVYFTYTLKQKTSINSFEDCAKLYPVMESYPEQCNTPDGKHFTRQLSEEEKQDRLIPPTEPSPRVQQNEIANWKTYQNKTYGYSFKYPSENIITENGQTSIVNFPPEVQGYYLPVFYVNVIHILGDNNLGYNNDSFTKNADKYLATTTLGGKVNPPSQPFNAEFTHTEDILVDGKESSIFESNIYGDKRVLLFRENQVIMLGGYSSDLAGEKKFEEFLSTFKFLK